MSLASEKYFLTHRKLLPLPRRRKKTLIERNQLFASAEKVWSLLSTQRKSSSSQNRKHSHTGRLLYPRYSPAAARVMKSTKCGPSRSCTLMVFLRNFQILMRLCTKSAGTIEQKGVAQLLQIEEVRLKSSRRCGFSQSPHAQEANIFLVF